MSLGNRISNLRSQCGLSQYQLSKLMDVSRQAVSKWESDQTTPDTLKMIKLAEVLDTDIEFLATGRKNSSIRPPVVINSVETVETIVEKPVVKIVEKIIEKPVIEYIERPVVKKVFRKIYIRNPVEYIASGVVGLIVGVLLGLLF